MSVFDIVTLLGSYEYQIVRFVNIRRETQILKHKLAEITLMLPQTSGWPKNGTFLYVLTLSNINRFSTLFHFQNREKICNNTVTKVCRYTAL